MKLINLLRVLGMLTLLFIIPNISSAQIQRVWSVGEHTSTLAAPPLTGSKIAYRLFNNSLYYWNGSAWVRFAGPGIIDTNYTLSFTSPNLSLLGSGSSVSLTNLYTAGYGLTKTGETWKVDTTSPDGLATRLFAKTLPTSIIAGRVAVSDGANLVGYEGYTWANAARNLNIGSPTSAVGSGSTVAELRFTNSSLYAGKIRVTQPTASANDMTWEFMPYGLGDTSVLTMTSTGGAGTITAHRPFIIPVTNYQRFEQTGGNNLGIQLDGSTTKRIRLNSYYLSLEGNTNEIFQATDGTNVKMRLIGSGNLLLGTTTNVPTSIFTARSTTKSSSPFPFHTTVESNAIAGVNGNFEYITDGIGPALSWYNGTRKAYGLESTFARGTATRIPFFDANGQVVDDSDITYSTPTKTLNVKKLQFSYSASEVGIGLPSTVGLTVIGRTDIGTISGTNTGFYWTGTSNYTISNTTNSIIFNNTGANTNYTNLQRVVNFNGGVTASDGGAFGYNAQITAAHGLGFGTDSRVTGLRGIAIGNGSLSRGGLALGSASVSDAGEFVAAAAYSFQGISPITEVFFGSGKNREDPSGTTRNGAGTDYRINGSGARGTDQAGGIVRISGGKGTGTGTPGSVIIQTSTALTTGSTLQTYSDRWYFSGSNFGNVSSPSQTLHISGSARLTGSAGTATNILGRDASGDISNLSLGSGLSITSGVLNATGSYSGWKVRTNSGATTTISSGDTVSFNTGYGIITGNAGKTITARLDTNAATGSWSNLQKFRGGIEAGSSAYFPSTFTSWSSGYLGVGNPNQGSGASDFALLGVYANPSATGLLQLIQYGSTFPTTPNVSKVKSSSSLVLESAFSAVVINTADTAVAYWETNKRSNLVFDVRFNSYGNGAKEATDQSVTQSPYIAGYSTGGHLTDYRIRRDTFVQDANFTVSSTLLSTCQELYITAEATAIAADFVTVNLPAPSSTYANKRVEVYTIDASVVYGIVIDGTTNGLFYSTNTSTTDPAPATTLIPTVSKGATYTFTCTRNPGGTYYWKLKQQ